MISAIETSRHLAAIAAKPEDTRTVYEEAAVHFIQGTTTTVLDDQHSTVGSIIRGYSHGSKVRYYRALTNAKRALNLAPKVVYAPGHGNDVSHCEVFYNADKIINLDVDPHAVELMRKLYTDTDNIESHVGYAETFKPDYPVDLLIVFGAAFDLNKLDLNEIIAKNGYFISNPFSEDKYKELEFLGRYDENGLIPNDEEHYRTVLTDKELLRKGTTSRTRFASYADVLKIVYKLTGQTSGLIKPYNELRDLAIAQVIQRSKERHQSLEYKRQLEEAHIEYFDYNEDHYRELAKHLGTKTVTLSLDNREFELKPLPDVTRRYNSACVYKKVS